MLASCAINVTPSSKWPVSPAGFNFAHVINARVRIAEIEDYDYDTESSDYSGCNAYDSDSCDTSDNEI